MFFAEKYFTNRNLLHIVSYTSGMIAHLPPKPIGVARRNVGCRLNGCFLVKDNHYSPTTAAIHVRLA